MHRSTARAAGRVSAEAAAIALIAVSAAFRTAVGWAAGLCYGESFYFSCALHPSLSYFDHPPLAILLGALGLTIAGEPGPLAVRLPFIAMFAGTTWLMFLLGRRLFGPWPGFYAALALNLAPLFTLSVGIFLQPDGPLMLFWLATVWCLARVLLEPADRRPYLWWIAAGATLGLAMLSKYSAALLVPGAGAWILARAEQRRWLRHPAPWLALGVAALIFSPVIVWNARHQWISFLWQGKRGVEFRGIHLDWLLHNIGGQAVELFPWIWLPLVIELYRCFRRGAAPERQLIGWLSVTPIVLFTAVAAYAPIGNHFHWGSPGYLLLFLPLGETIDRALRAAPQRRWWLGAAVAASLLLMSAAASHTATGWLTNVGPRWLTARLAAVDDPTTECIDYTALEDALRRHGLLDRRDLFVFADRWYQAGKLDYALKGRMPVLCLHPSDPRSYAFFDSSRRWLGKDGLLVTAKKSSREVIDAYAGYFEGFAFLDQVTVTRGGRPEIRLYLYLGQRLRRPYPQPYG